MNIDSISYNFSVVKVLLILVVVTAHYFSETIPIIWIPSAVALFIFAFSSGFFTSLKYKKQFEIKSFWKAKVLRLLPNLIVINIFLFVIFVYQHKTGIFSWQTIPALFGMSGILTWMEITRTSPFGHGLWFFTLLFIFYALYPVLEMINKNKVMSTIAVVSYLILFSWLSHNIRLGHSLWLTAFAFCFGVYSAHYRVYISPFVSFIIIFISVVTMGVINVTWNVNEFNSILIIIISVFSSYFLLNKRLPDFIFNKMLVFSGSVLEIYFIHTYVFVELDNRVLGFLFSTVVIVLVSLILNQLQNNAKKLLINALK